MITLKYEEQLLSTFYNSCSQMTFLSYSTLPTSHLPPHCLSSTKQLTVQNHTMAGQYLANSSSQIEVPHVFRMEKFKSLDLYEITIDKLQQFLADGRLTSVEYVKFCLDRIHKVGKTSHEP